MIDDQWLLFTFSQPFISISIFHIKNGGRLCGELIA